MKLICLSIALLVSAGLTDAESVGVSASATNVAQVNKAVAKTTLVETNLPVGFTSFQESPQFAERVASFALEPEVNVHIDAPAAASMPAGKNVLLIFYSLPNGNSTEQTIGRKMQPGDDWHFDIQHIGAQTRFLRHLITDRAVVVVYLEAKLKSWPAWRKKSGDKKIPEIIATIRKIFSDHPTEVVLSGHSGGGSFIFGYLNAVEKIPNDIERIAFLDSNYAYDPAQGHTEKFVNWLKASDKHCLCVLAYNDANGLLDGKPFVSVAGGTWGRSHLMITNFSKSFHFTSQSKGNLEKVSTLNGRFQFQLKENPERKIFHTVQVERNGFIHCMVSGTTNENKGYEYFGERAYGKWIQGN